MTVPTGRHTATTATAATADGVLPHAWLSARLSVYLRRAPETIDPTVPLAEYGMDSVAALSLCGDLEEEFGLEVEPTLLWDHPTVASLVRHLSAALAAAAPAGPPAGPAATAPADQR
ncbi:acyl carrier protein [Streptomyces sp. ISL-44]|uniref:acyl carrier protein n=1 Tax=Streptomyces sp. ISL-44 TaxID=2819184 RepID=UPI001BE613F0|nr:acyl carrier protein [Streptomyces sp. ISL-44]MBT2546203.1 acyl carrier protein [Streptomyces sp. ISL-44]